MKISKTTSLTFGDKAPPIRLRTRPYVLTGVSIVIILFGALGSWSAFAMLGSAVLAPAVVAVQFKRKTIQHLEGGIVEDILVRDGDYVEQGQVLLKLDRTSAKASTAMLSGRIDLLRVREARLSAELQRRDSIDFPDDLDSPNAPEIISGEVAIFLSRELSRNGKIDIMRERMAQFEQQIAGLEAQEAANETQIELIGEELDGLRSLLKKGYAIKPRLLELERRRAELKGDRGKYLADITGARNSISEAQLQVIQIKNDFQELVTAEFQEVQAELDDLNERYTAAKDALRRLYVASPQSGIVVGLSVHTRGAVLSPGQKIMDIVPQDDRLVIEAQVAPQDIDKVTVGFDAAVRLTAFDLETTPELNAEVMTISADRLVDEKSGVPYYLAALSITNDELEKLESIRLVPGMPAEVAIRTGERTALSYLMKPLADGVARAFKDG
ncbi:MAG: HlyD family type I secretion periplasmic adaptor subunit [Geminicoccaceae bacterium]